MVFFNVNYPQAITELDPSYSLTYQLKFYLKQNDCLYIDIYVKYKMHYSQLYYMFMDMRCSELLCGCSSLVEFLTFNDSFGDNPEQAFFLDWALYQFFPCYLLFPLPALFNANPRHQRAHCCVVHELFPIQRVFSFLFFLIET